MAYETKIGKNIVKNLMFTLYDKPETIYREYIQNAYDSINEAVKKGILKNQSEGQVSISIDEYSQEISIEDNGIGISSATFEATMKNIACSNKVNSAGCYGIGHFVGGGYCKTLSFKTSVVGEDIASEIIFDIDKIDGIINDNNDYSAGEVIDKTTTIEITKEEKDKHYFIVTLKEIKYEYTESLLNKKLISKYVQQIAPIDYSPEFKNTLIKPLLECNEQFANYYNKLTPINVSINNITDIRKGYSLKIAGTNNEIFNLEFFLLKDEEYGDLAWGWYAITEFSGQITDNDETETTRCIRLRCHNIQIGEKDYLNKYFSRDASRGNTYFNGEVHIINSNINLTLNREGIGGSPETSRFLEKFSEYSLDLHNTYRTASTVRSAVKEYQDTVQKIQKAENDEEKIKVLEEKKKEAEKKIAEAEKKAKDNNPISIITKYYNDKNNQFKENIKKGVADPNIKPKDKPKNILNLKELTEKEVKELTKKHGEKGVDMLKKILQILNEEFKDSNDIYQQTIKKAQDTLVKQLIK